MTTTLTPHDEAQQALEDSAKPQTPVEKAAAKAAAAVEAANVKAWLAAEKATVKSWLAVEAATVKSWLDAESTVQWLDAEAAWLEESTEAAEALDAEVVEAAEAAKAADGTLATAIAVFVAKLSAIQEGGYFRQLGYESYAAYAQETRATALGTPSGSLRNDLIVAFKAQLPKAGLQVIADIVGSSKPTVSRVLDEHRRGVATTGSGQNGHGGAREATPRAPAKVDHLAKISKAVEAATESLTNQDELPTTDLSKLIAKLEGFVTVAKVAYTKRNPVTSSAEGTQARTGDVAA